MITFFNLRYLKYIILFVICLLFFSGCIFQKEEKYPDILVTTVGVITKEDNSFFSSYILTSSDNIPQVQIDSSLDVFQKNEGEEIVIKGFLSSENFIENKDNIPILTIIDTFLIDSSWKSEYFPLFNLSIKYPKFLEYKETKGSIIFSKENDNFFVILKNEFKDWDQKLHNKGTPIEKIILEEKILYRQKSGNTTLFYYPEKNIQIDFYGESIEFPLLYTILETLVFEEILENEPIDMKEKKISITDEIGDTTYQPFISDIPPLRIILSEIFKNQTQLIPDSEPFYIERIEVLHSFVSVEYREKKTKKTYKILWAVEWKSLFLEELSFQFLASFEKGEEMRWNITKGSIPDFEKKYRFFLQNLSEKYTKKRPKNFIWYVSPQYQFTIGYPKKMYYALFPKDDTILEHIGWGVALLQEGDIPNISLKIIKGKQESRQELFSDNKIILPKSDTAHFELSSRDSSSFSLLQEIADSLVLHK